MAGNTFGNIFRVTSFGESHGPAIGGVIDGCPAGLALDHTFIDRELARRKTGAGPGASGRREEDTVEFLSGLFKGMTTGTPLAFVIRNRDQRPGDYDHLEGKYRPSHADFTYEQKYGIRDHRGGGRSSARETAVRVVAGAIAKQVLQEAGVTISAFVSSIGQVTVSKDYHELPLENTETSPVRCPDATASEAMVRLIEETRDQGDTLGGTITCIARGVPAGLGEPIFDKLEATLARAVMSINAVKGFDIGSGTGAAAMKGSEHNDRFVVKNGKTGTLTNHSGGVQGGISNGEDIYFRAFFKPVATLMKDQLTVDEQGNEGVVHGKGRHDVCVVPRAVPIVEAMAAITLADFYLLNRTTRL